MLNLFRHLAQITLVLSVLFSPTRAIAQQSYYGHFIGRLVLAPEGHGSSMRLLEPYTFIDSSGGTWYAPAGTVTDGASIPQAAKSLVGGSWDGPYRNAAVIHDVACVQRNRPWESVHLAFYYAMLASDVAPRMAKIMYAAVYHFGRRWQPGGSTYLPPRPQSPNPTVQNENVQGNRGSSCREGEYEQCWRIELPFGGEAKDCKCLPNAGAMVEQPGIVDVNPKAEAVIDRAHTDADAIKNLARYVDAKERERGISIEEIQKLNFQNLP